MQCNTKQSRTSKAKTKMGKGRRPRRASVLAPLFMLLYSVNILIRSVFYKYKTEFRKIPHFCLILKI